MARIRALGRVDREDRKQRRFADTAHEWGNWIAVALIIVMTAIVWLKVDDAKQAAVNASHSANSIIGQVAYVKQQAVTAKHRADDAAVAATILKAGVAAQTRNRAGNVATWCNAINHLQGSLLRYVRLSSAASQRTIRLHHLTSFSHFKAVPFRLDHLPCVRLESSTLQSTKVHK